MAISVTVLDSGAATTDGTTRVTGSVVLTPAANRVFLAIVINQVVSSADLRAAAP